MSTEPNESLQDHLARLYIERDMIDREIYDTLIKITEANVPALKKWAEDMDKMRGLGYR